MTAVHQLLPVYSMGDAIGGAVAGTRDILRRHGLRSRVYAELYDRGRARGTRPATALIGDMRADDAVMYHLSIGSPLAQLFERAPGKKILVYHNITPSHFYADASPRVRYWLDRGRDDLQRLAPRADLCIADSVFNESELADAGARRIAVIPPPIDLARLRPSAGVPADPPYLLFVGRLAPNKRHDDLIRVLAALRAGAVPQARLVLAGSHSDTSPYVTALRSLAQRMGVADAVEIPDGPLTDSALAGLYRKASVFVCASEHEGFCIPLVEAMAFSIPVVARAAGAVPATLGDAGILLESNDPLVWAEAVARAAGDKGLRRALIAAGHRRLESFSTARIADDLVAALGALGLVTTH